MSADRREALYRDASVAAGLAITAAALAALFLPFQKHGNTSSLFGMLGESGSDRGRIIGALVLAAIPLGLAIVTFTAAKGAGPSLALRIVALVAAFPLVAIPVMGAVLEYNQRHRLLQGPLLWVVVAYGATLFAVVAFARGIRGGRWKCWAHLIIAPALAIVAVSGFLFAEESSAKRTLVGIGATVFFAAAGVLVPVALFILFPRRARAKTPA